MEENYKHWHIAGETGTGKTTLAMHRAIKAIRNGEALVYIDPHGHDTDAVLPYIPPARRKDVVLFDPTQFNIPWNPFETDNIPVVASAFATGIKNAWGFGSMPTAVMWGTLAFTSAACMEAGEPLSGLYKMLIDAEYREKVLTKVKDPVTREFWESIQELNAKDRREAFSSTLNKVRVLFMHPCMRALCYRESRLNIPELIQNKILLIRLPQGELGLELSRLISTLLLTQIHQAALVRDTEVPLHIILDQIQNYPPEAMIEMLAGIRKFNVSLTCIHHYLDQLDRSLQSSLKANATPHIFRVSIADTEHYPPVPPGSIQLYEQEPYEYIHFPSGNQESATVQPLDYPTYKAFHKIKANMEFQYARPAAKEIV